jgi:hypothetical protein
VIQSAIYEGSVHHRRRVDKEHAFGYRLFLLYLDLDELEAGMFRRRLSPLRFRREDYMGPADRPLKLAVLDRMEAHLGRRPSGAVRMLTQLRTFGYVFNPVTFYYAFDPAGQLEAVAAEITNTPWAERHTYVLDARGRGGDALRWRFRKEFHVSPFLDMDVDYAWRFSQPGPELEVHMTNLREGEPAFQAGLRTRRRELTVRNLAAVLLKHPLLTYRVSLAIYLQAALLWLKRAPFHVHPSKRASALDLSQDAPAS